MQYSSYEHSTLQQYFSAGCFPSGNALLWSADIRLVNKNSISHRKNHVAIIVHALVAAQAYAFSWGWVKKPEKLIKLRKIKKKN